MVCMLRYAQVIEHSHHCWTNTSALVSGCINALGLVMVGNFQVSRREWTCAFSPLYKSKLTSIPLSPSPIFLGRSCQDSSLCGSRCSFPAGLLFVCLQCVLTYRIAETALDYWMAHVRVALSAGALVSLVLSILAMSVTTLYVWPEDIGNQSWYYTWKSNLDGYIWTWSDNPKNTYAQHWLVYCFSATVDDKRYNVQYISLLLGFSQYKYFSSLYQC